MRKINNACCIIFEEKKNMKKPLLISLYLFVSFFLSCENSVDTNKGSNEDLIQNYSFEINGNPSINGWTFKSNYSADTLFTNFSNDVPPSGGKWSVFLIVSDRIVRYLQIKIAAPTGENHFKLSVWAKSYSSIPTSSPGFISLALNNANIKRIDIQDSTWRYYETMDTISAGKGDTITVELFAGTAYMVRATYYDLCRLELLK
jgi:hypothetical protein